jgi:biotin carboxyl carrier protein
MHKKFKITVDGRAYNVEVEEIVSDVTHPHHVPEPLAPPSLSSPTLAAAPAPVAAPAVTAPAPASAQAGDEVAPLAGVVDSVVVTLGQAVAVGDKIAVIEAMKMKTEVFAKNAGKVASIAVKAGQSVDGGQVLLSLS